MISSCSPDPTGAFSFPNISIVILVCQLLNPHPRRNLILYTMVGLQIVFAIVTIILAFAQCQPTRKLWEKNYPGGSCWNPNVLNYFSYWFCAYTTLTDFVLAIVPVTAFWQLQMPRSTKIGLCVRNAHVRAACETYTDFVHLLSGHDEHDDVVCDCYDHQGIVLASLH
jgi:hypothetical protein